MIYKTIFPVFLAENTCQFSVWAPKAHQVNLLVDAMDKPIPMQKQDYGYWRLTVENIHEGTRYRYQINNAEFFPDPASLSQPEGVHEASEVIDLHDYHWNDAGWKNIPFKDLIIYELHTGAFAGEGTFESIKFKLDYLKKLGVNAIEIMPVAQFSGHRNWGYDGVYPFAVQNTYGGARKLMELVDACHQNDIAVILDVVYNHFGPEGNYVGNFGHYFSEKYSTPWGQPINFDGEYSDGVRNYVVQNALMWCRDFHIDGLRLDAVHAIYDFSAKHILQELAEKFAEVSQQTGRNHYLIAESHLNDVRYISPISAGGYGLDATWSDDFHHVIHTLTTGERKSYYVDFGEPDQLLKAIKEAFVFDGQYSEFRKKSYGNSTTENSGEQFVIFNQNHDQVGNRLHGDRLISMTDFETAKVIAGVMFLAPNVPMLFMGEEYGEKNPFYYFVSHLDTHLNQLVREGRKQEFKEFFEDFNEANDPDSPETFEKSKLSWIIDSDAEKKSMFDYYRQLIHLRKTHPVLRFPDKDKLEISNDGKLFELKRWQDGHQLIAFINFEEDEKVVAVPEGLNEKMKKIFDSEDEKWNGSGREGPDSLKSGEKFKIQQKSLVIYSN